MTVQVICYSFLFVYCLTFIGLAGASTFDSAAVTRHKRGRTYDGTLIEFFASLECVMTVLMVAEDFSCEVLPFWDACHVRGVCGTPLQ